MEYYRNRVLPYLKLIWPESREISSPAISESFARLCVAAREAFPEAFDRLRHWLKPLDHPDYLIDQFSKSSSCKEFPDDALAFLQAVIGDNAHWLPQTLQHCLDEIRQANPTLATDQRYRRLDDLMRLRGIS